MDGAGNFVLLMCLKKKETYNRKIYKIREYCKEAIQKEQIVEMAGHCVLLVSLNKNKIDI